MNISADLSPQPPASMGGGISAVLRMVQALTGEGAAMLVRARPSGAAEIMDAFPDHGQSGHSLAGLDPAQLASGGGVFEGRLPLAFTVACGRRPSHVAYSHIRGDLYLLILSCCDTPPVGDVLESGRHALAALARIGEVTSLERTESARLAAMVRIMPVPFIFVDWQEQEVFVNDSARTLLGLGPLEGRAPVVVAALTELVRVQGGASLKLALDEQGRGAASFNLDHRGRTQKVDTRWVEGGPLRGRVWTFHDITAERELEDELRRLASTDFLTGALNRRAFELSFRSEMERAQRFDMQLGLVLLDLDHFKRANDTYGHEAGDRILKETCRRVSSVLREDDRLARVGGEEFAVLMSDATLEQVTAVADRIRVAVRQAPVDVGTPVNVTCSLGLTCRRPAGDGRDEMMARADAALYQAKADGRDRVHALG